MALGKLLIAVVILGLVTVGGVFVFMASGQEAHRLNHTVTNESATVTLDEWNALDESNVPGADYADDEVIRNASGDVLTKGDDYEWNTSTGEIRPLSGTDATQSITATYNYTAPTEGTQFSLQLLPDVSMLLSILAIVGAAMLLVGGPIVFIWGVL